MKVKSPVIWADSAAHSSHPWLPGSMVTVYDWPSVALLLQALPPVTLADTCWLMSPRMSRLADQPSSRLIDVVSSLVSLPPNDSCTAPAASLTTTGEPRLQAPFTKSGPAVVVNCWSAPCGHRFPITEVAALGSWAASIVTSTGWVSTQPTWSPFWRVM